MTFGYLNDVGTFGGRVDCGYASPPNKTGGRGDRGGLRGGVYRLYDRG